jgi:hypothetical protein
MRHWVISVVLLAACRGDDDLPPASGTASGTSTTTSTGAPQEPDGLDSTGGVPECADAHHGNQGPDTALPIAVGTDASDVTLGDLFVCSAAPSDFFALEAECAGYLSVEVRRIDRAVMYMPDLVFYDGGHVIEHLVGGDGFHIKPLQRHVGAGTHMIEVRHAGGGEQRYSLVMVLLPDSTCWP